MKKEKAAQSVQAVIREYVELWKADRLRRGMGILPERDQWVSEHEMRERFVSKEGKGMTKDDAVSAFGRGLRYCEDLGYIVRDPAPLSTSIRLA